MLKYGLLLISILSISASDASSPSSQTWKRGQVPASRPIQNLQVGNTSGKTGGDLIPKLSPDEKKVLEDLKQKNINELVEVEKNIQKLDPKKIEEIKGLIATEENDTKRLFELKKKGTFTKSMMERHKLQSDADKRKNFEKEIKLFQRERVLKNMLSPVNEETLRQHIETNNKDLNKILSDQEKARKLLLEAQNKKDDESIKKYSTHIKMQDKEIQNRSAHIQLAQEALEKSPKERISFQDFDFYRQIIGKTYNTLN